MFIRYLSIAILARSGVNAGLPEAFLITASSLWGFRVRGMAEPGGSKTDLDPRVSLICQLAGKRPDLRDEIKARAAAGKSIEVRVHVFTPEVMSTALALVGSFEESENKGVPQAADPTSGSASSSSGAALPRQSMVEAVSVEVSAARPSGDPTSQVPPPPRPRRCQCFVTLGVSSWARSLGARTPHHR